MQQWVWKWIPGSATPISLPRTSPERAGSTTNMGTEHKGCDHSLFLPGEILLVPPTEQLGTQGRADGAAGTGMSKEGRNQPQPAPHNQQVSHRELPGCWLALGSSLWWPPSLHEVSCSGCTVSTQVWTKQWHGLWGPAPSPPSPRAVRILPSLLKLLLWALPVSQTPRWKGT